MAGGGNDFLLFEADGRGLSDDDRRRLALVCRRGLSVGADGALFLSAGEDGRVRVDYYNADGGPRVLLRQRHPLRRSLRGRHGLASGGAVVLETGWGPIGAHVEGER